MFRVNICIIIHLLLFYIIKAETN